MLLLTFGIVVAVSCLFWHLTARPTTRRYGWHALWRMSFLIAALRIGAFWVGATTNRSSGWLQVPGYFLQLTGLPEIYFVRSMRNAVLKWEMAASLLLLVSSFVWAALFVWAANRFDAKTRVPTNRA